MHARPRNWPDEFHAISDPACEPRSHGAASQAFAVNARLARVVTPAFVLVTLRRDAAIVQL
jgi:hypothetical protein